MFRGGFRGAGWGGAFCLALGLLGLQDAPVEQAFATFNIENFPKASGQAEAVFDVISGLQVSAVTVQEIVDPVVFEAEAKARLGASWRFEYAAQSPRQRVGVLFDEAVFELLSVTIHEALVVYKGAKAAVEVRLRPRRGGAVVRLVSVHLKSHRTGRELRKIQLVRLEGIIQELLRSGERVLVMGDFNSTEVEDREDLARLAERTGIKWASSELECSAYWNRRSGCFGSALDQVLASWEVRVEARGACAVEGCQRMDRCPVYTRRVSDHCPVRVE